MKQLTMLIAWAMSFSCMAGMIITKQGNKVTIGKAKENKTKVQVYVKIGKTEGKTLHSKKNLRWYTTDKNVVSYYTGAKLAYKTKQYTVASFLAKESIKKEPKTEFKAKELIRLMVNLKRKKDHVIEKTDDSADAGDKDGDTKTVTKPNEVPTAGDIADNVVYKLVKDNLIDGSQGTPKPFDAKKLLTVKYYFLCFATLEFSEYRGHLSKLKRQHELIQRDHPGRTEFIFIPTGKTDEHLAKHLPGLKLPFPILKHATAKASKFNSIRGNNNLMFAVVSPEGRVASTDGSPLKGQNPHKVLRDLFEKLEEEYGGE